MGEIVYMTLTSALYQPTNEQRILRAPSITLADHRAMFNAGCRRPQAGEVSHMGKSGQGSETVFLQTSFMDDP